MKQNVGKNVLYFILQIDELLREKKYPSKKYLSEKFEVSERSIERYFKYMKDMYSAPIKYDQGKNGYYYSQETFFLKSLFLKSSDFFSIAVIEKVLRQYKNTPLQSKLSTIFNRLRELLPEDEISIDTLWVDNSVTFISEPTPEIEPKVFNFVFKGLKSRRAICFYYQSLEHSAEVRIADPYHIVCQRGAWYVIAFCRIKKEMRIFAFSRMKNILVDKKIKFTKPKDFSPSDWIDKNVGVWLTKRKPFKVSLLFSASVSLFAQERIWGANQSIQENKNGSVKIDFETNQMEEIKRFVLGQGSTVEVLEPAELLDEVKAEIIKMNKIYS